MGCFDHGQEYIGTCMWCGKQLCSRCVARASGKKLYCHNCASNLGDVEIRHEPQYEPVKEQKVVQQPQAKTQPMQLKSQVKPLAGKGPTIASLSEEKKIQAQQSQPIKQNISSSSSTISKPAAFSQAKAAPSATPVNSAARNALSMFAQSAQQSKTASAQPAAPQQKTTPVSSPAASSAAKSALGMFAQQAMEQLEAEKKKKENK